MKILQLIKTATGATWALRQVRELIRLGIEVHVALPQGPLVDSYTAVGAQVHILQTDVCFRQPVLWYQNLQALKNLVQNIHPDIVHSHFVGCTLSMRIALRSVNIPRVFQVPGPLHLEHALFRNFDLKSAGQLDYWVASCKWTQQCYLQSGVPSENVFLSYYGVDVENFTPGNTGRLCELIRKENDTAVIGIVAYMYSPKHFLFQRRGLKGHEDLIDAIRILLERGKKVKGIFVGGAWSRATAYEERVKSYGEQQCGQDVVFLGTRTDIAELYAEMDIVVHPSHSENVGGAVESLLMGCPTITTNVGGFPDLITEGETGWMVQPKNPIAIADKIDEVLQSPENAERVAFAGRKKAAALFDVRNNAQEIYDVYQQILTRIV